MNKDERDIRIIICTAIIGFVFTLGIIFGKYTAIHNCYMVSENAETYVLNFNGTEHLYLREEN